MENSILSASDEASLLRAVDRIVGNRLRQGVKASSLTTFAIGGPLDYLVTVESLEELQRVVGLISEAGQTLRVIGFGSNLLVPDAGLRGWIIKLGAAFRQVERDSSGDLIVPAAASLMALSRKVSDAGLSGLEFAAGIPASLGGAVFMNAGAHGAEIGERVVQITGVLADGSLHTWAREDLPWRYRCSGLPSGVIVTSAMLRLVEGDRGEIGKRCAQNLAHRRATQPLSLPSAGSVFKNPSPELSAGRVLEESGLKGVSVGGAMVSPLHANWIVNPDRRASSRDVTELIGICRSQAHARAGVSLEVEVRLWD